MNPQAGAAGAQRGAAERSHDNSRSGTAAGTPTPQAGLAGAQRGAAERSHDTLNGTVVRVSVSSIGEEGGLGSRASTAISADGRYVAFGTNMSGLVPGDTTFSDDIFVHDRDPDGNGVFDEGDGETTRVSVSSAGEPGDGPSWYPDISADGRHVVFVSFASNLVQGGNGIPMNVFAHDRQTGTTVAITDHTEFAAEIIATISADGRFVAFRSPEANLVPDDTNGVDDIFVHDRDPDGDGVFDQGNGVTTRVSVSSTGEQADYYCHGTPSLSADGRFVAFGSDASNLVPGNTNIGGIFVRDRLNGTTERASVSTSGCVPQMAGSFMEPGISADGSVVLFASAANGLVPGDTNGRRDVFVRDRLAQTTTRVSVSSSRQEADADCNVVAGGLSADGRTVAFVSAATALVAGDDNGVQDVFLVNLDQLGLDPARRPRRRRHRGDQ